MSNGKTTQVKEVLRSEIEALQNCYLSLKDYVSGKDYDPIEVATTLQVFKDSLDRISSHVLTLHALKGQKAKITWDSLLENLETAKSTVRSASPQSLRPAIQIAFSTVRPNAEEVMDYLGRLYQSLK